MPATSHVVIVLLLIIVAGVVVGVVVCLASFSISFSSCLFLYLSVSLSSWFHLCLSLGSLHEFCRAICRTSALSCSICLSVCLLWFCLCLSCSLLVCLDSQLFLSFLLLYLFLVVLGCFSSFICTRSSSLCSVLFGGHQCLLLSRCPYLSSSAFVLVAICLFLCCVYVYVFCQMLLQVSDFLLSESIPVSRCDNYIWSGCLHGTLCPLLLMIVVLWFFLNMWWNIGKTCAVLSLLIRESFCESEEGVRLPRETADLRGSPGNFRGSLGNFRGTSGLLFSSTVRELPGKSPKTSGEVRGTSGKVRGLSRSSGEPDSLPVTRQICLQVKLTFHVFFVLRKFC